MNDTQVPPQESTAPSGLVVDDPLWYKDAVIYQLNVKSFLDSNDDGIGDFPGLTSKLTVHSRSWGEYDLADAVLSLTAEG
jgi:hypothetical protein